MSNDNTNNARAGERAPIPTPQTDAISATAAPRSCVPDKGAEPLHARDTTGPTSWSATGTGTGELTTALLTTPNPNIIFFGPSNKELGRLHLGGPKMTFSGDTEASAKVLFDFVVLYGNGRIAELESYLAASDRTYRDKTNGHLADDLAESRADAERLATAGSNLAANQASIGAWIEMADALAAHREGGK